MRNCFEIENVRETNILHTKCSKLANYGAKKIQVYGALLWNSIPENTRNSLSLDKFKHNLKMYLLDQYKSIPEQLRNY